MNIFHELAEKAFSGEIDFRRTGVGGELNGTVFQKEYRFWAPIYMFHDVHFYDDMNLEEQALALLFIGEMYESQKA